MPISADQINTVIANAHTRHTASGKPALSQSAQDAVKDWAKNNPQKVDHLQNDRGWTAKDFENHLVDRMHFAHLNAATQNRAVGAQDMSASLDECPNC